MRKRQQSLLVTFRIRPDGEAHKVQGRDAWALLELVEAGQSGCTPIDNPGPRWSAYVFKLKRLYGLSIQTITEAHRGPFAGTHARLCAAHQNRSSVTV